jgi:hypothetical protein
MCLIAGHKSNECQNEKVEDPRFNGGGGRNNNNTYGNAEPSAFGAVAAEGDWASGVANTNTIDVGVAATSEW